MIRRALASDAPQLLSLMRGLARFEGYDDRFAVTVDDLIERGFSPQRPPQSLRSFQTMAAFPSGLIVVVI